MVQPEEAELRELILSHCPPLRPDWYFVTSVCLHGTPWTVCGGGVAADVNGGGAVVPELEE